MANENSISEMTNEGGQLSVDVFQSDKEFVIQSTVAGVRPEDLDISISHDVVTIKGKRFREIELRPEDFLYQECYYGSFYRTVILPQEIDAENSRATLKNGILTLHLPKVERTKTHKIRIQE